MAREVDLHIRAFLRNTSGLDAEDMVLHSLDRLHDELKRAVQDREKQIKFIHGKGKGSLRERVYQELRGYRDRGLIRNFEPSFFNEGVVVVDIV